MHMILHILLSALVIFVVAKVVPGVRLKSYGTAIVAAIVLAVLGFFLGKVLTVAGIVAMFPVVLILGNVGVLLIVFLVNTVLLWITDKLLKNFQITTFKALLLSSLLITIAERVLQNLGH